MSKAVVLLSGGQDSTTCLFWAVQVFDEVVAMSFDYGQRHASELEAGRKIAELAGVARVVVDVPCFHQVSDTALVNFDQPLIEPLDREPSQFLPARNIVFLSIAAGYAAERGIENIVLGVCGNDYTGYADCRPEFVAAMEEALTIGVGHTIRLHGPLLYLSKAETVRLSHRLPGCWDAMALTQTCEEGTVGGCGECPACKHRQRGFISAGIEDPLCTAT